MKSYRFREMSPTIHHALQEMPVVVLTGMRQVGKSTLLRQDPLLKRRRYVSLDDFAQLEAAQRDPEAFVRSDEPLTIDEAQRCPELLVAIKQEVDRRRRPGWFLLSGSANFSLLQGVSESLAGRSVSLTLHPFSRRECLGEAHRPPFVKRFFETPHLPGKIDAPPVQAEDLLKGGMPSVCLEPKRDALLWFKGFEQTYLERDVRDLLRLTDLVGFRRLLRLAALRTGKLLVVSELARDAQLTVATATRYLSVIEASFVLHRVPPCLTNKTSRLIKSPKMLSTDAGLACYLAGIHTAEVLEHDDMRGALYETYVAQNLMGLWPEARLAYWHIQGRHEVDFVIESGRDSLAIEVKAGNRWTDREVGGLSAFLSQAPRCRAGILAYNGKTAARLGDRLWAIPLGLLLS